MSNHPQIPKLKAWLEQNGCRYVRPVVVTIGEHEVKSKFVDAPGDMLRTLKVTLTPRKSFDTYEGCIYRRTLKYTEGMMAVTRGERKVGEEYVECSAYLLGERPKVVRPGSPRYRKVCFRTNLLTDWYVACYVEAAAITPRIAEYHPFGPSFIIKPWLLKEAIDAYEFHPRYHNRHVPYTRYSLKFDVDVKADEDAERQLTQPEHPSGLSGEHDVVLDAIQACCLGGSDE